MGFNFADTYVMDSEAVEDGAWVPIGGGAELKVARGTNQKARKLRDRLAAKFNRPGFRARKATDDEEMEISRQVLAQECLKDWRGIDLTDVADLLEENHGIKLEDPANPEYHPKLGLALFREFEDFFIDVMKVAGDEELFRKSTQEADLGN